MQQNEGGEGGEITRHRVAMACGRGDIDERDRIAPREGT